MIKKDKEIFQKKEPEKKIIKDKKIEDIDIKEKQDKDANYMHIMPVNKLTSYSTNKTTMLFKKRLEPEKITQNTSYIYTSVHNLTQNINNKNIINNFIIDSNAYRNSNVDKIKPLSEIKTNFEYLNDSKTYNSKKK